jgi:hypothetical protein
MVMEIFCTQLFSISSPILLPLNQVSVSIYIVEKKLDSLAAADTFTHEIVRGNLTASIDEKYQKEQTEFRKTNGNPRYCNAEMKVRKYPMSKSIGYF